MSSSNLAVGVGAAAIVPHDTNLLSFSARAVYVGTTGNLKVTCSDDSVVTFVAVPAGMLLPVEVKRVWATGTTASNLVGIK